ncbi:hypothetical protein BKA70DRAFT_1280077 [Coprinopsis sp. MPI-PUGE-AT-0042]|nr:hypothetical protein BKA70DRAFT_1280077 [Coprinopsis sp. MPI-PUGE-AT-0042]
MTTEPLPNASIFSRRRSRHASHYLSFAIFCVEDQLYCLPKDHLSLHSDVFSGMFSVDNGTDGQSDDHPIVLEGYKSKDFDALLKVIVPKPLEPSPPELVKEEWVSVLKLSTIWQMDKIRTLTIDELSSMSLSPLEKIVMAREYVVPKWLSEGVTTLVRTLDTVKIEDIAQTIGWETTARIYAAHSASQKIEFDQKLRESQDRSVQIARLECIGCNQAATSTQTLTQGCPCGGQETSQTILGTPSMFGDPKRVEKKRISGYKVAEQTMFNFHPFSTINDRNITISAIVASLFGPEIEAMKDAASA